MTQEKNKKKPTFVPTRFAFRWVGFLDVPRTVEKKWSAKGTSLENLGVIWGWCGGVGGGFEPFRDFRKRRILYY